MSESTPYQILGVAEDASFEEIQEVKNRLLAQYQGEEQTLDRVEAAYDAIIMERLRLRQEGKIKVPERIRFPERTTPPPAPLTAPPTGQPAPWLQRFIDTPSRNDILLPAGIFAALGGITVLAPPADSSLLPLLLVGGVFTSLYFLNRKENKFGRAFLLTLAALLLGVGLGALLTSPLSGLPLGGERISALAAFLLLWLVSSFLR
ncbi:MAG: CPP1-like family protein [Cyanobacteriota bacterium]|nr:CPP1-like family protein [Cyanobacteriota bacterium]